ncbi:ABC transporter permease [Hydrogenimonas thermophila]|uniref:ABC-type transport system, involved in lipoprotein release, permease component n=1 Tax=Hydrogenimonas thermophila TaxID=223786 RepID=A0A1I5TXL1_9BACT|nr:FtsX-like permease family protein [Hydrogenimonas thermophila]SFP87795.1 ABC-type transport system, involved in lipoprotein release, permease component [Hydrogenimonas thermophila]
MKHFLAFALSSLTRRSSKNIFIFIIFTFLIFILSSVFMITNALKTEMFATLKSLPDITVQRIVAGRQTMIDVNRCEEISKLFGVSDVNPRVWGYYYLPTLGVNFSIVGVESFSKQYNKELDDIVDKFSDKLVGGDNMIVGVGVLKELKKIFFNDYFYFVKPDGSLKKVKIAGVFKPSTSLESNDIIIMDSELVREIFEMDETKATDIVVNVANHDEVPTIAKKIREIYPDSRVITKDDLKTSYTNVFNYKSGLFLALFIVSIFTFFIIIYDKASGLSSEERREIGILKAIGWKIDDILKVKLLESVIISGLAYLLAVTLAVGYVFGLQSPVLRELFMGYSVLKPPFDLPFVIDGGVLALIFFTTIPIYTAATIIPAWRAATLDADEAIR